MKHFNAVILAAFQDELNKIGESKEAGAPTEVPGGAWQWPTSQYSAPNFGGGSRRLASTLAPTPAAAKIGLGSFEGEGKKASMSSDIRTPPSMKLPNTSAPPKPPSPATATIKGIASPHVQSANFDNLNKGGFGIKQHPLPI